VPLGSERREIRHYARRALRRAGRSQRIDYHERRTAVLALLAFATTAAVAAGEIGRVWRRGSAPLPADTEAPLAAAGEAVVETVEVALAGYQDVSSRENAMFNLLASFITSFLLARGISHGLRSRTSLGPFRNVRVGRRHIHHFVPGILMAFGSGATAIVTRNEDIEPKLALVFGSGMGLTFDESALLLELEDVYWTPEGLLSVQITLTAVALLGALALGLRFLRRGEQVVLEASAPPAA
jgi:hypothetical protein